MNHVSAEQSMVIHHIKNGKNVVVDACAGSGKSTTILSCAKEMPEKKFLQITYNSMLRMEIKEKVKLLNLKNIVVHTYHSLAVSKYSKDAFTDSGLRQVLYQNMNPLSSIKSQDVIVLDEAQDMTFLYFQFVVKYCRDMDTPFQLLILGDYMQGLYEFKGADIRFLTMAQEIWNGFPLLKNSEFMKCTLKISYRITRPMSDFVNKVMLGDDRMEACKDGKPVLYIRNSKYFLQRTIVYNILELIKSEVNPNNIFVLGASVKGVNSQIRRIENVLVEAGIPCHVPMLETDKIDEKVINGKVVFSTFHCVKGRQRPYVFVIGFDNSYFNSYAKTNNPTQCPNTLYVACTRAEKGLFLLERADLPTDQPLKFLKMDHNEMKIQPFIDFKGQPRTLFYDKPEEETEQVQKHHITPTELIKFIPESVLEEISPILDKIFEKIVPYDENNVFDIPTIVETQNGYYEDVSDLNGIAIPAMYYDYIESEWDNTEKPYQNVLYDIIKESMNHTKPSEHLYLKNIINNLSPEFECVSDYLYLANIYVATQEKLYFKLKQIERNEYNWLKPVILSKCKERILDILEEECKLEKPKVEETILHVLDEDAHVYIDELLDQHFPNKKFRFTARIDLISANTIWELKCTSVVSQDHLLQVVIYCWLWRRIHPHWKREFKIFNSKTGEILLLNANNNVLDKIILLLLNGKYETHLPPNDTDFLIDCNNIIHSL
jgi:hypothetical protein